MKPISLLLRACLALVTGVAAARDTAAADALEGAMRGSAIPAMAGLEMRDGQLAREAMRGVRRNDGSDARGRYDASASVGTGASIQIPWPG